MFQYWGGGLKEGFGVWVLGLYLGFWSLKRSDISVPFLLTFLFVPLLPVPFLHALFLPKVILSFNKQTLSTRN